MSTIKPVHVPACCPACYALLDAQGQRVADVVRRLIQYAEPGVKWHIPRRVPLCEQAERAKQETSE